jgi:hypothetical protein
MADAAIPDTSRLILREKTSMTRKKRKRKRRRRRRRKKKNSRNKLNVR